MIKRLFVFFKKERNVILFLLVVCILIRLIALVGDKYFDIVIQENIRAEKNDKIIVDSLENIIQNIKVHDSLINFEYPENFLIINSKEQLKALPHESIEEQIEKLELETVKQKAIFDSLSPLYTYNYRKKVSKKLDFYNELRIKNNEQHISKLELSILFFDMLLYLIYIIAFIMYPVRLIILVKKGEKIKF
tara:strand:- start:24 stop:596 length:573 start_codon:yes stop_codon:yes gene_type:complete